MKNEEVRMKSAGIFSILHSPFYIRIIRWVFDRFYHEFAWTYDAVAAAVSGGRWGAWGQAALPYLYGRVLELGCGTGALQSALARRMAGSVGVDASAQMLDITMHKLNRAGRPIRLARAVAQARHIRLDRRHFSNRLHRRSGDPGRSAARIAAAGASGDRSRRGVFPGWAISAAARSGVSPDTPTFPSRTARSAAALGDCGSIDAGRIRRRGALGVGHGRSSQSGDRNPTVTS
jgi:SAM-dependent methyltransferase